MRMEARVQYTGMSMVVAMTMHHHEYEGFHGYAAQEGVSDRDIHLMRRVRDRSIHYPKDMKAVCAMLHQCR